LTHDLGKARTDPERWPSHAGHEELSVALVEGLSQRLRVPTEHRELAVIVARYHGWVHRASELRDITVLKLLESTDAFRRPERFDLFLLACEADARGRAGLETQDYPQADMLRTAFAAAKSVVPTAEDIATLKGAAIADKVRERRLEKIRAVTR